MLIRKPTPDYNKETETLEDILSKMMFLPLEKEIIKGVFEASKQINAPVFSDKHKLKAKLKEEIPVKFIVGNKYMLRYKQKFSRIIIQRTYLIKQIIWCIDLVPVQAVIVKPLDGQYDSRLCLNIHDCERLHVKYEPGLKVMSMKLNWIKMK